MVVKIEEIREGGLNLNEPVELKLVQEALAGTEGFRPDGTFQFQVKLQKVGTGVLLNGAFTATVVAPCKRCLVEVPLSIPTSFTLNLVPQNLASQVGLDEEGEDDDKGERGGSFRMEDAEEEVFDGKQIDLGPILREQLLLALPMNAVCRDECRGLCMACGQNLNEKACGCDTKPIDPRLAALKNIKLN
jgi:uncharacterized protein